MCVTKTIYQASFNVPTYWKKNHDQIHIPQCIVPEREAVCIPTSYTCTDKGVFGYHIFLVVLGSLYQISYSFIIWIISKISLSPTNFLGYHLKIVMNTHTHCTEFFSSIVPTQFLLCIYVYHIHSRIEIFHIHFLSHKCETYHTLPSCKYLPHQIIWKLG